jgi:glucose-6-phosphate dehydrogenase assembly protein OpcA
VEDLVSAREVKMTEGLLPGGRDVAFAEIEATLASLVRDGRSKRGPARAATATVIVVGTPDRLAAAAEALEQLGESGGVRAILISEGDQTSPVARVTGYAIAIAGLAPRYLNNAVAALRLSSLPAVVWCRGGTGQALDDLDDLARLADRLVLDIAEPDGVWARADGLFERTALTDLRWTRLTRWRAAVAHLFDLSQVRRGAAAIRSLTIETTDPHAARLFAGWLKSRLRWTASVAIEIHGVTGDGPSPLVTVRLAGDAVAISLSVRPGTSCLEASVDGAETIAQIVPLGNGTLASLIGEELGVRTRDFAFEQALVAAREISA